MVNPEIVGTDVDMNWELNSEGDISTVHDSDNISQGIYLRLTAYFDSLDWCYQNYGSFTKDWLGKIQDTYNRTTLEQEINSRVILDPRVDRAEVEINDWNGYYIGVRITVFVQNKSYEEFFIFGGIPRKNEDVYHSDYLDTYIDAPYEFYVKPGVFTRIHCHVMDENDHRVPIGEVSLRIGNYLVGSTENPPIENPQEIAQSGSVGHHSNHFEAGCNTFEFRVPQFIAYGDHDMIFHYKGIKGYNSCSFKTILHVVERIPTSTHFIYPRPQYHYYYANDVDYFTDPQVFVLDYNDGVVDHGTVRYYLDEGDVDGGYIVVDYPLIFYQNEVLMEEVYIKTKDTLLDCSTDFVFSLNRMFHTHDRITLQCANGEIIDYLEVYYHHGIYHLTSVDLIFTEVPHKENCDIILKVVE